MSIEVECYSGHRADVRPLRFKCADYWLEVRRVVWQWQEQNAELFDVEAEDGRRYLLRHDRQDEWTLDQVR